MTAAGEAMQGGPAFPAPDLTPCIRPLQIRFDPSKLSPMETRRRMPELGRGPPPAKTKGGDVAKLASVRNVPGFPCEAWTDESAEDIIRTGGRRNAASGRQCFSA